MSAPAAPAPSEAARRVARNMGSPFAAQLLGKVLGIGYFMLQARLLSQDALGQYTNATVIWLYASTIADWGLGTWLTREIAARRGAPDSAEAARAIFAETLAVRLGLAALAFLPALLIALPGPARDTLRVNDAGATAVLLLGLSLLPGAFSSAVTALYNANERLALPAAVQFVTSLINTGLGIAALILGFGPAGLAGAALLTTAATAGVFYRLLRRDFFPPALAWDSAAARRMLTAAFPLMLNGLLIILFFRFDQPIIQTFRGPGDVAIYEAAYKVINFTQIITPSVVLALFPAMARAALHDRAALTRQYRGAVKFLLLLAAPLVVGTIALAPALITIITLGKPGYLPASGWALAILIGYLPFSFINGVTQYVLIALHRQGRLTWAIGATALFNIAANLLVVPVWGIYGAAAVTVLSEIVLLVPFLRWAAGDLGIAALRPGGGGMKLALAALGLALVTFGGQALGWNAFAAALAGGAAYLGLLAGLRIFSPAETALLGSVLRRRAA
jgi:O-antigen/teichoic acid export membrane protein